MLDETSFIRTRHRITDSIRVRRNSVSPSPSASVPTDYAYGREPTLFFVIHFEVVLEIGRAPTTFRNTFGIAAPSAMLDETSFIRTLGKCAYGLCLRASVPPPGLRKISLIGKQNP